MSSIVIDRVEFANRCYVLMGLPGVGKTTWRDKVVSHWRGSAYPAVICLDDLIQEECDNTGESFNDVYTRCDHAAYLKTLKDQCQNAIGVSRDIIIDGCHVTEACRGQFLTLLPDTYQRIGITISATDNVIYQRLEQRANETGRFVSSAQVRDLAKRYQRPGRYEFHRVTDI